MISYIRIFAPLMRAYPGYARLLECASHLHGGEYSDVSAFLFALANVLSRLEDVDKTFRRGDSIAGYGRMRVKP